MPLKGYKQSVEHRRKRGRAVTRALTGYKQTPEHVKNAGARLRLIKYNLSKKNKTYKEIYGGRSIDILKKRSNALLKMWKDRGMGRSFKKRESSGFHSNQQWEELKRKYNYTCLSCKRKEPEIRLTKDHIVPLSLGGSNNIQNIQPLCKSCNSSKWANFRCFLYEDEVWQMPEQSFYRDVIEVK